MEELIKIEAIRERDIDLLLLEEIHSSLSFRNLICRYLGINEGSKFIGAWHSIHSFNLGETDLLIKFVDDRNNKIIILIENKIDAAFTNGQAKRYIERAKFYIEEKKYNKSFVLLIAPLQYLQNVVAFTDTLSYEEIKRFLLEDSELPMARKQYKSQIIDYAIEKKRRGYSPVPDSQVTEFQHKYYEFSNDLFPKLNMRKPNDQVPSGSGHIYFSPEGIQNNISLVHKFKDKEEFDYIDIQFDGQIDSMNQFINEYEEKIDQDISVEKANKSFVVRKRIDKMSRFIPFEDQKNKLSTALIELNNLYSWLLIHFPKK